MRQPHTKLVKELRKAAQRGVRVRIVVNEADRDDCEGAEWDALLAAGAELRFKRNNDGAYQMMHDKLAIIDGAELLTGSGSWSGSAFFNNFEAFAHCEDPAVLGAADTGREWVELHNPTSRDLDLGGLRLRDDGADSIVLGGLLLLPAGGYILRG